MQLWTKIDKTRYRRTTVKERLYQPAAWFRFKEREAYREWVGFDEEHKLVNLDSKQNLSFCAIIMAQISNSSV